MFGGSLPFDVSIAPDANDNSAVAVDLVVVYDKPLVDQLLKLPASDWFKQKQQFGKDHPGQIDVHHWEWVPNQTVDAKSIPYKAGARKVIVFADYRNEGEHRAAVDPQQKFKLVLGNLDFQLESQQ